MKRPAMIFPTYWITAESVRSLNSGGNIKGTVPIHAKRSRTANIPLFTKDDINFLFDSMKEGNEITVVYSLMADEYE